jgi:ABC-type transport system involved in cytochrome bd biosynthesis fused ATPase/permease subunit
VSTSFSPPSQHGEEVTPSIDRRLLGELGVGRQALTLSIALGVLMSATVIAQAVLLAHLIGWAMATDAQALPVATLSWLIIAMVARALLGGFGEALSARSGRQVTGVLRAALFSALSRDPDVSGIDEKTGSLALSATRGLRSLEPYFSRYLPAMVVAVITPPLAIVFLAVTDWPSALVALVLLAVVPFAMVRFGRKAARESDRQWRRMASLSGRVLELLRGLPTLRALGQVDTGRQEIAEASDAASRSIQSTLRAAMLSSAALEFLAGVGVGLVAMLAGFRLLNGSMSVVPALAVILVTPEVFLPLRRAGAEFHASTEGRSAATSIFKVLDAAPKHQGDLKTASSLTPIIFDDVSVNYSDARLPALSRFSLHLEHHDHVVLRGPSGSGKTTVTRLLCAMIQPTSGELTLAGLKSREIDTASWRDLVSLVPQRPHVFAASLHDNLLSPPTTSDDDLLAALELVGLMHLAAGPEGLARPLAEGGLSLSAGERQRLGIARVLLQDRPVVVFDEATVHLDQQTIYGLRRRLAPWLSGKSVLETGHRPGLLEHGCRVIDVIGSQEVS